MKKQILNTTTRRYIFNKLSILLLVALISCSSSSDDTIIDYPKHSEIVYNFFSEYSIFHRENPLKKSVDFHKTPKGIEVIIKTFEDGKEKVLKRLLYWDAQSRSYQKLNLPASNIDPKYESVYGEQTGFNAALNSHINFDLNYFYNYGDWNKDVIEKFEGYSGDNPHIKYSLSQAYIKSIYRKLYTENFENEITIKEWNHALNGVEILEGLSKENFKVETIIGDIEMKLSNDIIGIILENRYNGWAFDEKDLLNRVVYNDFLLSLCKTVLNACPPNTILFTNGDNDTYPLYYLQWKEGFRKDIAIVNTSLLNVSEYRSFIRREYKIKAKIPESYYGKDKFSYGGMNIHNDDFVEFKDIEKRVLNYDYSTNIPLSIDNKIQYYNGVETVKMELRPSFVYEGGLAQIDMICNNTNPVYFFGHSYLVNIQVSTSDKMPYLYAMGTVEADYKAKKTIEVLEQLTQTTIQDIQFSTNSTIEMALYHYMYSIALDILKEKNMREEYEKYAHHYLNFTTSEETLNNYSLFILFGNIKNSGLGEAIRERCKSLQNRLIKNVEEYTSDINIDEFVIQKMDNTIHSLVYMDQFLDIPLEPDFKGSLMRFFNQVYEKKPYLRQTVINNRSLHRVLHSD